MSQLPYNPGNTVLRTEERNPATARFDEASTAEMLQLMEAANERSVAAVREALPQVARAVDTAAALDLDR